MSETTNIKLFKHYNPSTNTNQFDVEKSLNQNWDKIDTEIGNIRENINGNDTDITDLKSRVTDLETNLETAQNNIDEIKEEQITQNENIKDNTTAIEKNAESIEQNTTDITKLQEDNAKLKAQIPKGQASGEEISLSDSAKMELVDFGLQGNSKQDTREGYNLVKASNKFRKGNGGNGIIGSVTTEGYLQVIAEEENENWYNSFWSLDGQESINKIKDILKVGDTFTIAFTIKRTEGTSKAPTVYIKENSPYKTMLSSVSTNFSQVYYTGIWEDGFDISIIHLGFANLTGTFIIKDWMVKKGNIAEWQEYGVMPSLDYPSEVEVVGDSGNVEIVTSNKNVLDLGQGSANGITYNKNRITVINPTNSINITSLNLINNKNFMGKSLTLTFWANGNVETNNVEVHLSTNKETYRFQKYFITGNFNNTKFAFTRQLQNDEYFTNMTVYVPTTALPTCNLTIDLQMEIKTATDFVEHQGNTYTLPIQKPFYKLGDYADAFIKQEGKWYEQHYIKEYIFNGTENFAKGGTSTNNQYIWDNPFTNANTQVLGNYNDDVVSPLLSNFFISIGNRSNNAGSIGISFVNFVGYTQIRIGLGADSEYTTVDLFKSKLKELYDADNSVKVYYVLATPELIECTEEQTQVLEQIVKDGTYKEVTHFYTTEDLKPIIEVKYYKDLETLFNKQAELENTLNNVQAQILELGGN